MIQRDGRDAPRHLLRRYARDSPEFERVANLSDAVIAITMTLLVLDLQVVAVLGPRACAEWA